jgi:hypothetical protein
VRSIPFNHLESLSLDEYIIYIESRSLDYVDTGCNDGLEKSLNRCDTETGRLNSPGVRIIAALKMIVFWHAQNIV